MKTSSKVAVRAIAVLIILAANVYPQAIPPDPNTIAPVINAPHPQTNIVISLANYLVENGHPVPPHLALTHALDACRAQHAARLIVPTGRYVFNDPQIAQQMFHIGVFSLADLTIDGQGSDFVFHYPHTGFLIQDCHRVVIRNLTIDTDLVLASLGVAHRAGGNTNIRFLDSYPVAAGTPLLAVSPYDIANLKWKAVPGEIFNPRNVTMIAPQTFTSPDFASLADGEEVIVRHYTYGGNAFVAYGNTTADIGIENVTIYGAPGMGFYFSADRGFRLSGDRIVQKPGRPLSTATDGCHFTNNRGDILVENCDFSGQGDDSVNLASLWIPITHVDSARTFVATRQYDDLLVRQGSQLKIVRANDLSELGRVSVTQVSYDPASGRFSITVGQNLPANVSVGDLITNLTQSNPRFLIRGNYFHDHRARGMLVQALNGVVEDNVVRHSTMSGIELFTEATYFLEGPGAENVIVKNNTFDRCGYGNYGTGFDTMGVINMSAGVPTGISGYGVNRNILIDGNVVSNAPGLAVFLGSASDITLSNNVVINSNTLGAFPPWYGSTIGVVPHGSIMAAKASNVLLTDNLEVNRYQQPETGIYFDPGTTTGSRVQNNSRATPSARGTLSLTGAYVSGSPITVLATPDAGAHFVNWTENGSIVGASRSFSFTLHANRNLLANFALGAPPPVAITNPASLIASFSSTLNGTVNPYGLSTTVHFEYGTTTSYGSVTASQTKTGNTNLNVNANISGLTPNTTHHFRIVATSSAGTTRGNDRTFTTLSATGVPVIITNPASLIASFSATFNGSVYPHGLNTSVYFQYGTTTSYGLTTAPQTKTGNTYQNISANISGLSATTTYHFRIVATNSAGTTYGADHTITTLSATGLPVVITNPATNVASSSATLNGKVDPHGLTTSVHFQYGTTNSYGSTTPSQTKTGNTYQNASANITGLSGSTTYHLRIVATNIAGIRYGPDKTFTTP